MFVLFGKGDHQITSSWTDQFDREIATTLEITRSNVTFIGKGKGTTTILGGFRIENIEYFVEAETVDLLALRTARS